MKKICRFLSIAAMAALAFSACTEELNNENINGGKTVTVHFGTENTDPSTKATLTPDAGETAFQAAWENGDELKVKYSNDSGIETATGTTTATWNGTSFESTMPEYTGLWIYDAAYPVPSESDNSVDFGPKRTQKGNAYNSKYDIMIGSAVAENAAAGKDESDNDIIFQMDRQTAIAYFHFTSELDEVVTSATLKVTDGAIANSSASINEQFKFVAPQENDLTEINLTFEEGTAPSAKDFQLWFNVLPTTYNVMTLTVETATKSFTIKKDTKGELDMYEAGKLYKVKKSDIEWTDKAVTPSGPTITKITSASAFTAGTYIIMTYDESYYVPNAAATNAGPELVNVVKTDGVITITPEMIWNATVSGEGLEFTSYVEPGKKLWGAPKNDGVRVSDNSTADNPSSVWKLETLDNYGPCGYAAGSGTAKYYLSTYGTKDWRNYKSSNLSTTNKAANFFKVEGWVDSNHSISIATVDGGTLSASPRSAAEGTEVTLTATPDEGYAFNDDWTVKDADEAKIDVTDGKFTMPAKDVTVSGSFSKVDYTITKATCEGGSFTVKKNGVEVTKAQMGESITLTASAADGYEFDSWTVTIESTSKTVYVNENTFTMPGANVTVQANFVELAVVPVYASLEKLVNAGAPTTGGTYVTVTLTNDEITGIYTTSNGYRNGIYFKVGTQEVEIYCKDVPESWVIGGYVSGTLTNCAWKLYSSTWELCPSDWSELIYAAPCETPVITLDGAVATITCATEGATIHYTLDGTEPVEASDVYTAAVTLTDGETIKAKAFLTGHKPSEVASKTYSSTGGESIVTGFNAKWTGFTTADNTGQTSISASSENTSATITSKNGNSNKINCAAAGLYSQKMSENDYWLITIPNVTNTVESTTVTVTFGGIKVNKATNKVVYKFQYSIDGTTYNDFGEEYTETTSSTSKTLSFTPGVINNGTLYIRALVTSGGSTSAGSHYIGTTLTVSAN